MRRRRFIAIAGAATMSMSLAGCGTDEASDSSEGNADDDGGDDNGTTSTGNGSDGGDGGDGGGSLEILEDEYYEDDISAGVEGTVKNNSDSEISYVEVQAEFLDSEGTRVGEGLDNTSDLAGGQEWAFDCMATSEPSEIDDYRIEVSESGF